MHVVLYYMYLHVPTCTHVHIYSAAVFKHLVRKWVNYVLVTREVCFVQKCGHTVDVATSCVYLPSLKGVCKHFTYQTRELEDLS